MNIHKKKILASLFVLSSALVLVFAACKTESAAPTTSYTITVEPRGGTGVAASYTVQDGQTVTIPDPKKDNNKFLGWCYTADGNSVDFVSGTTTIDGNKTIYALWQQTSFKVTVDGNGVPLGTYTGGTYNNGDTIPAPTGNALPVKTDYEIAYWSKTKDVYTDHFEFGTSPVTSDMTLYPHWRYSIAKIQSMLRGNWLVKDTAANNIYNYVYKISAGTNQSSFCAATKGAGAAIDIQSKQAIINIMKALPNSGAQSVQPVAGTIVSDGVTYNYLLYSYLVNNFVDVDYDAVTNQLPDSSNGTLYDKIRCYFNSPEPSLNSYILDNTNDIRATSFLRLGYFSNAVYTDIVLKSIDGNNFVLEANKGGVITFTGVRIP